MAGNELIFKIDVPLNQNTANKTKREKKFRLMKLCI